ncbi:MAG: penicillin-binding protein activator [Alphaproteobacteria bacterium]
MIFSVFSRHRHITYYAAVIALAVMLAGCAQNNREQNVGGQTSAGSGLKGGVQALIPNRQPALPAAQAGGSAPRTITAPSDQERALAGVAQDFQSPTIAPQSEQTGAIGDHRGRNLFEPRDSGDRDDQTPPVDVALLVPLSGPYAAIGDSLLKGAELGFFTAGAHDYTLTPYDIGGGQNNARAIEAARGATMKAVNAGAKIILGPLLAQNIEAIKPLIFSQEADQQIPILSFSNSGRVAGNGIFVAGNLPDQQVIAVLDAAIAQGRENFALIAPDNAYGRLIGEVMSSYLSLAQVNFVEAKLFDPALNDFDALARQIADFEQRSAQLMAERQRLSALAQVGDQIAANQLKALEGAESFGPPPFDALLLAINDPNQLLTLSAQLSYYDIDSEDVQIMGLENFSAMANLEKEPALHYVIYPRINRQNEQQFSDYYHKFYQSPAPDFAGVGFDMAVIAVRWLAQNKADYRLLSNETGYRGAEGLFRFNQNGLIERNYEIEQITPAGTRTLIEAAGQFVMQSQ